MNQIIFDNNDKSIAEINSNQIEINTVQDFLDWMASASYGGATSLILHEQVLIPDFFDLKTKLAGDMLQKAVSYRMKVAIVGEFSKYESNSLNAFIVECNRGRQIFFVGDRETAVSKLTRS